jgi:GTPase SAR1 family protein
VQVVLLGNGRSGKTSILRTLAKQNLQPDEPSTRGVDVDARTIKLNRDFGTELSFWDFAGQLEYSAAHEFFMSTRQALYVIVYSVLEEDESTLQQLFHWLSVIPELAASPHVRLMIIGTKIDLVDPNELQGVMDSKRRVVHQVLEARDLASKILHHDDILFVSSSQRFNVPSLDMTWETCRHQMKHRIYVNCNSIFEVDEPQLQVLKFPKECRQMQHLIESLKKDLMKKQTLPCCRLDHEDAVRVLSQILHTKDKNHLRLYYKIDLVVMALEILSDLGIIVLYGGDRSLFATEHAPSICLEPQFLPRIMSLLVDSQTQLPAITNVKDLLALMMSKPDVSRISQESPEDLKQQLVDLLEAVGLVRRFDRSSRILVPLTLQGKPVCWSDIIRGGSNVMLLGWRLVMSPTASLPASYFMKLMLDKCVDDKRMWGCAFAYNVRTLEAEGEGSSIFVRLKEDRRSVDVVAVMDISPHSANLARQEVDSIARMLGKSLKLVSGRMHLCPMCCCTDTFVRSGAAHAFHKQEVDTSSELYCSRYHRLTASEVISGKATELDTGTLPLVYPSRLHELQLPWRRVESGGVINRSTDPQSLLQSGDAASLLQSADAASPAALDSPFRDGVFTDVSFFVLTGQVAAGDVISADSLPEFTRNLNLCSSQDCVCDIILGSGQCKTLHFSYTVGQYIPNTYFDKPIACIFPANIGDRAQQTQEQALQRFCAHDNVLVLFGPVKRGVKFLMFPGSSINLQLFQLTPALCQTDLTAARCWSELQVRFCSRCAFVVCSRQPYLRCLAGPIFRYDGS